MKNFFASLLGTLVGMILAFFLFFIILIGIISHAVHSYKVKEVVNVPSSSVLEIRLNHTISERTLSKPFNLRFDNSDDKVFTETVGLNDILADINHAAKDSRIKGIFLNLSDIPSGMATIETIRKALAKFKESGKFIIAYSLSYSQKSYYLASVADKVYLYPEGEVFWKGLSTQILFYKNALDKLGVQVQVFRHGRFKSYVEPYIMDKMSPDNKLQTKMFLNSIWGDFLTDISASRHIGIDKLNEMADSLTIRSAQAAEKYGIVDGLLYPDEVQDKLREKLGLATSKKIPSIGLDDYRTSFHLNRSEPSKIAVIYAAGDISQGNGSDESIGSARFAKAIREARLNNNIKAIVLRVNSPGGDAVASAIIWREIVLAKKVKPVIVSMGDYGASGGYEISCAATEIVAEPTTLTGSIGVFGMLPSFKGLLSDKLGITVDTVSTNTHSAAGSVLYPLTSPEAAVFQAGIEDFYRNFITRVADGRKMTVAQVDSIAQGRVWTGQQAIKIGLVDTLGGINVALKIAANQAHLTNYSIVELPKPFSPWQRFVSRFYSNAEDAALKKELGDMYTPVKELSKLTKTKTIQARVPCDYIIE